MDCGGGEGGGGSGGGDQWVSRCCSVVRWDVKCLDVDVRHVDELRLKDSGRLLAGM